MESEQEQLSSLSIQEEDLSDFPISDMLDEACAYYMAMGVSYEEFWYGDYTRLKYYERAYDLKRKAKNEWLWLLGAYIDNAVATELANFGAKKGAQPRKYLAEPVQVVPLTEKEKKEKEKEEKLKAIEFFKNLLPKKEK